MASACSRSAGRMAIRSCPSAIRCSYRECDLGELFYLSVDELPDVCFVEAMRLLLLLFVERLQEKPMLDEGEMQGQLQGFLKDLPVLLSQKPRKCA